MIVFMVLPLLLSIPVQAYKINDKLSIRGVLSGAYQYQHFHNPPDAENAARGALLFQPEFSFTPTSQDEIFVNLDFAEGNGLNLISPFILRPWGATLEDDVKDINGSHRDSLLTAWYKHTFHITEHQALGLTGGLIDATDYLDGNAYSNDEFTQFMNEALVNAPNAFLPSYDFGGALEWEMGRFSLNGVIMDVESNADGNGFQFYGIQLGYKSNTLLGEGNYRLIGAGSSNDFLDPEGVNEERREILLLSCDQAFGEVFGGWIRFGKQADKAAVNFRSIYSGGVNVSGKLWGRENDNMGIGYAYLVGGNLDVEDTHVAEAYARFSLTSYLAFTLDIQYMQDEYVTGDRIEGFIYGVRLGAEF